MDTSGINVSYIAKLAKIDLTAKETERFSADLNQVLAHVAQLETYDTTGIPPMSHPLAVFDAVRRDIPGQSLTNEEALLNAPAAKEAQFLVPKVVESAH